MAELGLDFERTAATARTSPAWATAASGRLAACFLDSLATLEIPSIGYGIRYEFGIFQQEIVDGWQVEKTDKWLRFGNPWEIVRPEWAVEVKLRRLHRALHATSTTGCACAGCPQRTVVGVPYDTPILGYRVNTANTLRLWRAEATESFDFSAFNRGDYYGAVNQKVASENLTKVLYPNDEAVQGKELRLEQQYLLRLLLAAGHAAHPARRRSMPRRALPREVRRPAERHASGDRRRRADAPAHRRERDATGRRPGRSPAGPSPTPTTRCCPRRWSAGRWRCSGRVLPRHLEIIFEINARFLDEVRIRFFGDEERRGAHVADRRERRALRAHGAPGLRRQPCHQWRGRAALGAAQDRRAEGFLRAVAGEVPATRPTASRRGAGSCCPTRG